MPNNATRFVAYLRVSTDRPGRSGLGLEAQREAVQRFVREQGGVIIAPEHVEVESGKRNDRPKLAHGRLVRLLFAPLAFFFGNATGSKNESNKT